MLARPPGYAGTDEAAAQAEKAARDVLAEQNLRADVRFECWDPSGQAWQDARAGEPDRAVTEQSDAHEEGPGQGRLQSAAAALIGSAVQSVIDGTVA